MPLSEWGVRGQPTGRHTGWLGACYQATFNVHDVVEPVLRELAIKTG